MAKQIKERVQVGTDDFGKPIYKWVTGFTKQEIFLNAARLLQETAPAPVKEEPKEKHHFKPYIKNWYEIYKKPTLRPMTARSYALQINSYLLPFFGRMNLEDITPESVQKFFNKMTEYSQESQQRMLNLLRMVLDAAVEDGIIAFNPTKSHKVHLTSRKKQEREPLEREQMLDIISKIPQVKTPQDRCFIAIQALHAMRPCEVLGLRWDDIDFTRNLIHIRRNVVHPDRNKPIIGETKTALSKRDIAISQIARPYIEEFAALPHAETDFIFGGAEPFSFTQHRRTMERIRKQMEIEGVTGYTFRHTIITDIYETTHDANIAAAVAGHSKTTTTMNRYSHARRNSAEQGIAAIDSAYLM